jgi:hypothetical protein
MWVVPNQHDISILGPPYRHCNLLKILARQFQVQQTLHQILNNEVLVIAHTFSHSLGYSCAG